VVAKFIDDDNLFLDMPRQTTPSDCEGFESYELTYDLDDDSDISLLPNYELQTLFH